VHGDQVEAIPIPRLNVRLDGFKCPLSQILSRWNKRDHDSAVALTHGLTCSTPFLIAFENDKRMIDYIVYMFHEDCTDV
jgi:hypothetical protein